MTQFTPLEPGDLVVVTGNGSFKEADFSIRHHFSIGQECIIKKYHPRDRDGRSSYRVQSISSGLSQSVSVEHVKPKQFKNNAQAASILLKEE